MELKASVKVNSDVVEDIKARNKIKSDCIDVLMKEVKANRLFTFRMVPFPVSQKTKVEVRMNVLTEDEKREFELMRAFIKKYDFLRESFEMFKRKK